VSETPDPTAFFEVTEEPTFDPDTRFDPVWHSLPTDTTIGQSATKAQRARERS
jgi:hypothetical protein